MEEKRLTELVKKAKADYSREWRKRNPEKVKEINDRYWLKKAAESNKLELSNGDDK